METSTQALYPITFNSNYGYILLTSITLFFIKAMIYVEAGSLIPLGVFTVFCAPAFMGMYMKKRWVRQAIKIWAVVMVLFSIIRLAIELMFMITEIREAHVVSQFTIWFNVVTLFYLVAGVYLYRKAKRLSDSIYTNSSN